jgi:hypothetical protein
MRSPIINLVVCFAAMLLLFTKAQAQNKAFEYAWDQAAPHTVLPDSLKKQDAVMLWYDRFILNDADFTYKDQRHYKVKILTPKGLREHSVVYVAKNDNMEFAGLDARTIKPDGKIVDLKSNEIRRLDFKEGDEEDNTTQFRFSIPGVQVGDEIEVFIDYENRGLPRGQDLTLETRLLTLQSSLTLKFSKELRLDMVAYNDMPNAEHKEESFHNVYKWILYNQESTLKQNRACPKSQIPYVSYLLRPQNYSGIMYENLHRMYHYNYEDNNSVSRDFRLKILQLSKAMETTNDYERFQLIYNYITSNIKLVKELPKEEQDLKLDYYLDKKYIDNHRLHVLLRHIFDEFKMKYYICVGRSRYEGYLDFNFIPPQAVSHFFFSFEGDTGSTHLVYPGYEKHYMIDELPANLRGTQSLCIGKPGMDGGFTDVKEVQIPLLPQDNNFRTKNSRIMVTLDTDSIRFKSKETYSGDFATAFKHIDQKEMEKDAEHRKRRMEELEMAEQQKNYPFSKVIKYQTITENFFQKMGPTSYYVYMGDLFQFEYSPVNDGKRTLDYYPYFKYKDATKTVLVFDREIASDNIDKLIKTIENEYAGVKLTATRMDAKTISIDAMYEMKIGYVPASDIDQMKKVNKALKEVYESKLVVVFK